jgi:hypothetical protein
VLRHVHGALRRLEGDVGHEADVVQRVAAALLVE